MTIKPFCIRRGDMTCEEVNDALLKCVDAGAVAFEGHSEMFTLNLCCNTKYFGVNSFGATSLWDTIIEFGEDAIEITLEQLDTHLNLKVKQHIDVEYFKKAIKESETNLESKVDTWLLEEVLPKYLKRSAHLVPTWISADKLSSILKARGFIIGIACYPYDAGNTYIKIDWKDKE